MPISVIILTKNSSATLAQTLASLSPLPEIIVFDTGSTDETLEIASQFNNVKIHQGSIQGFGRTRNEAAKLASYDWILSIDSDEVLSPGLIQELHALQLEPSCVYAIERENFFNGKRIRCCAGWYPDWVIRLYHRKQTSFSGDAVHEKVISRGCRVARLHHALTHVPYRSVADFLDKMQIYSSFFARQYQGKRRSSLLRAVVHGFGAFCKNYFLKRGIFGGHEGLIISLYNAQTTYYKYLKLAELNKKL